MTNDQPAAPPPLELWGGVECTIVRLGDDYRDQSEETGHRARRPTSTGSPTSASAPSATRSCGRRSLRTGPTSSTSPGPTKGLAASRARRPVIAGLLHHGSGRITPICSIPISRGSSPITRRGSPSAIPWIDLWTPVNEPLTTARFSGLYGHWYPHRRDYPSFLRALYNQCRGVLEAMRAIRAAHSRRPAGPDRGSRQDLLDPAAALPGGARE
jgi:dTDP-4-dehydrorhamnose reductase